MKQSFKHVTTDIKVGAYQSSYAIFAGLIQEMRELSKKKADATMSAGKVKIINRVLTDLSGFLKDEPEGKYLDMLDDEKLPQNSDAVLVMVQYESALKAFKSRYYHSHIRDVGSDIWVTENFLKDRQR